VMSTALRSPKSAADRLGVLRDIERLIGCFGVTKLLTETKDDDVAKLVAWRRGQRVTRHGKGFLIRSGTK
jgi:hypothetical protein